MFHISMLQFQIHIVRVFFDAVISTVYDKVFLSCTIRDNTYICITNLLAINSRTCSGSTKLVRTVPYNYVTVKSILLAQATNSE